jgi:hypothetical protein
MSEHPGRRARGLRRRAFHVGDDALRFMRWYAGGKYALMGSFLGELDDPPGERDAETLRRRFCQAVAHGRRVQMARTVVTALLALGVVTTAFAAVANVLLVPSSLSGDVAAGGRFLARVAAWSATFAVVLVLLRLAFDRYLELVDTSATFLAMQLATTPRTQDAP